MKKVFKTKKSKVLTIVLAIVLVIVIAIAWLISSAAKSLSGLGGVVSTVTVERRDLSDSISLTGTVKGATVNNVASDAQAKFTAVNVSVGDRVNAGDLLAVMDPSDIESSIKDTKKALSDTNALNNLSKEKNQETLAKAEEAQTKSIQEAKDNLSATYEGMTIWEDKKSSAKSAMDRAAATMGAAKDAADADPSNTTKKAAYETAKMAYESAKSEYEYADNYHYNLKNKYEAAKKTYDELISTQSDAVTSAKYAIETSKYNDNTSTTKQTLKKLEEQLDGCNVYAPISGVVTAVNVAIGDTNTPGRTIITIQDTSTMVLEAPVDETKILKLEENMKALVTSTATGDKKIDGTITRVVRVKSAGGADGSSGTYATEITLADSELLVGMTAKAKIVLSERKDVMAVPYDLIQEDEDGSKFVLAAVENEDGTRTAVRRNIEVGEEINYYCIVTGGDLQEGDEIFFDSAIEEGQTVVVMNDITKFVEE